VDFSKSSKEIPLFLSDRCAHARHPGGHRFPSGGGVRPERPVPPQAEGSRAFLSGMTATCVRQSLFSSVRFAAHDHLERLFQRRNGPPPPHPSQPSTPPLAHRHTPHRLPDLGDRCCLLPVGVLFLAPRHTEEIEEGSTRRRPPQGPAPPRPPASPRSSSPGPSQVPPLLRRAGARATPANAGQQRRIRALVHASCFIRPHSFRRSANALEARSQCTVRPASFLLFPAAKPRSPLTGCGSDSLGRVIFDQLRGGATPSPSPLLL